MVLLTHPTGNQNSRAVLRAFAKEQLLHEFHTSLAVFEEDFSGQLAKKERFAFLRRRQFDTGLKDYIRTYPHLEFAQRIINRFGLSWLFPHDGAKYSIYETSQQMDKRIAKRISRINAAQTQAIYAYEDMALRSFQHAEVKKMQCLYELPTGYWRAYRNLLQKEKDQRADWATTLKGFQDSEQKIAHKDEELKLANHIFVASQFTASTLAFYPKVLKAKLHIVPYGFPEVSAAARARTYDFDPTKRPLRLLFVGGLSQGKGLSYMFDAVKHFGKRVELTIVGKKAREDCAPLNAALKRHNWIPSLPHQEVLRQMREHDVLLFPSLFDGFGLVMTEAMSQGTPVIATERTAAPDIVTDGVDSYIAKAASTEALIAKIDHILTQPESLERVGRAAMKTAAARPWEVYGRELSQIIKEILNASN